MRKIQSIKVQMYSIVLKEKNADLSKAKAIALSTDWSEIEKSESSKTQYLIYETSLNGVDIWYQINGNQYFFSESEN